MKAFRIFGTRETIEEVEVVRWTDKQVVVKECGREFRNAIVSEYYRYFKSREEAVAFQHRRLQEARLTLESNLKEAIKALQEFEHREGLS